MSKSEAIVLKNVRLSFPSLFRKTKMNYDHSRDHLLTKEELEKIAKEQKLAYEASFLLDKKEHKETIAQIRKVMENVLKENNITDNAQKEKLINIKLKDGDEMTTSDGLAYQGHQGKVSIQAKSSFEFSRLNQMKKPTTEEDSLFYAGCYVNAVITIGFIKNTYGKFLAVNLGAIQFNDDGEKFQSDASELLGVVETSISEQDVQSVPF